MKSKLVALKNKLLHNWGLKVASIFLAFVIWFIVAHVGDPKDTRVFYNIPVRLMNASLLEDQNKVYEVLDNTDTVRVSVTAPTSVFQTLRASDIVAEADVSKLTDINTIAISYYTLNTNREISFDGDHDVVRLNVENRESKWIRVQCQPVGNVAEGYVIGGIKADQTQINISGPESQVSQVGSAYAELNVEGATSDSTGTVSIRLRDREGNFLELDNVEKSVGRVLLTAQVLATKEIPVDIQLQGTPADGYRVVGKPQVDVDKILIAGTQESLNLINRLSITKLDITDATENKSFSVNVRDYLGSNIKLADSEFSGRIAVDVTIKAVRERTIDVPLQNIVIANIPEGVRIHTTQGEEAHAVTLKIYGLSDNVNAVRAQSVTGTADITAWMSREGITTLTPGIYEVPVTVDLGNDITVTDVGTVSVEVTEAGGIQE